MARSMEARIREAEDKYTKTEAYLLRVKKRAVKLKKELEDLKAKEAAEESPAPKPPAEPELAEEVKDSSLDEPSI